MTPPLQKDRLRPRWRPGSLLTLCLLAALLLSGGALAKREQPALLLRNHGPEANRYLTTVSLAFEQASERIDVLLYVMRFGDSNDDPVRQLCRQLADAAARGVRVRVILDRSDPEAKWPGPDNSAPARWLAAHGVEVLLDEMEVRSHAKMLLIDDLLIVGSHNWTVSALSWNRESSIATRDPQLMAEAETMLNGITGITIEP